LLDAVELVDVVLPVLTALGCLSVDPRGVARDLPPGVGIPDPPVLLPGDVALNVAGLLLFFVLIKDEPEII